MVNTTSKKFRFCYKRYILIKKEFMKNTINISLGILFFFLCQACSEDKMDEINKDLDHATNPPSRIIITDVMTSSAFNITGSDLSFYAGVYAELNAGAFAQMYNAQTRSGEPQQASTYNNSWETIYRQLGALKRIMEKCSEGGDEEGNYQTLGIAQILYAYNFAILTDLFGDVPYTEALQPGIIFQPKLDRQEFIYSQIFDKLNVGIANLNKSTTFPDLGTQDLIYNGVAQKWIKAANGLLARYTMRLSHRVENYQRVIDYVNASFTSATDELKFVNSSVPNPYARVESTRRFLVVSKSFYDRVLANGPDDIRGTALFTQIGGIVTPLDNALLNPPQGQGIYSISAILNERNPIYLLSYHELLFLKAEAQARLGDEAGAQTTLADAITAAYTKQQVVTFTVAQANTYIASIDIGSLSGNDLLRKIMLEKYISFYENEAIEAYNDIRRLRAMGNANFIPLVHPRPDLFPRRFTYGLSDVSTNSNIGSIFGDGTYVYREDVWWAGGTR